MRNKIIKEDWSLDKIIEELEYELADPKDARPYNQDRPVTLSYGTLVRILKAIKRDIDAKL